MRWLAVTVMPSRTVGRKPPSAAISITRHGTAVVFASAVPTFFGLMVERREVDRGASCIRQIFVPATNRPHFEAHEQVRAVTTAAKARSRASRRHERELSRGTSAKLT